LRDLIATSNDAIGIGHDGKIFAVNAAYLALYGYEHESELVGRSFLDVIAPSAREMIMEFARRRAAGEAIPAVYVTRGLGKDGSEFDIQVRSNAYHIEDELYLVVTQTPIGEEVVMAEPEQGFYRAIFDVNTAIKLLIDPRTGFIVDANEAAIEFYGWPLDELREMRINDINTLTEQEVRDEMHNALTGHRRFFRFRHRVASGEVRHVEVYSGPVTFGERNLLLSIIHDTTEREALEVQLREAQRLEAVGRLAGSVAHEFNNLLTVMLTSWSMLKRSVSSEDPARRFVDDLGFAAERAVELSRGLLAFSRRQVLQLEAMDLNHVVRDLMALLQRSLGAAVEVELDLDEQLPESRMDPRQVETVLMNLVLNAADAVGKGKGGTITIRSRLKEVGQDARDEEGLPPGRWLMLEVIDDGAGMDDETKHRIFEPFFSTKGPGRGTGLGLSTVHGIVHQIGGRITVESEIGKGTRFEILLPVVEPRPSLPGNASRAEVSSEGRKVILVDDNEAVRKVLAQGLRRLDYEVIAVASAEEARASSWADVDAIITDIVLPGVSGAELAREAVANADIPIVVISGDLQGHDLTELPDRVVCLQKPITPGVLAEAVERVVSGETAQTGGSD
jgi:PAS domain S-box-containing protein